MSHDGFGIKPGSAAKAAEDGAGESSAVPRDQFRGSIGIRMTRAVSQKFELPKPASEAKAAETAVSQAAPVASPVARKSLGVPLRSLLEGLLRFVGKR
ncbi:MAG: hypothetical protein ACRD18_09770 [Terriglobia bacterium]